MLKRAVFLDRDGVINEMVYNSEHGVVDSPSHPDQFKLLPGVGKAIRILNEMNFYVFVVSNQPGIAKGKFNYKILQAITAKMVHELETCGAQLDGIYYCLHHPDAVVDEYRIRCNCRKPNPGLLQQACKEYPIDLRQSYMIGDGLTDVQAGKALECNTIFIGQLKCDICKVMDKLNAKPDFIVKNLGEGVSIIEQMEVKHGDIHRFSKYDGDKKMEEIWRR